VKVKVKLGKSLRAVLENLHTRQMNLLLVGNDTVPISMWHGGGLRTRAQCRSSDVEALDCARVGVHFSFF